MPATQAIRGASSASLATQPFSNNPTPPELLTKKWLVDHFGCRRGSGGINTKRLYSCVLTDQVLAALDLSAAQVRTKSFKTFTRQQSMQLRTLLGI